MRQRDNPFGELEQLFEELTDFDVSSVAGTPLDLIDEGDAFVAVVDLPGFTADDIDVQLDEERTLRVQAARGEDRTHEEATFIRRERRTETVDRSITLPSPVDPTETEATFDNGVLTVRLGKKSPEPAGTDIEVTEGTDT